MDYIDEDLAPIAIRHNRNFEAGLLHGRRITPDSGIYFGLLNLHWARRLREDFNNNLVHYVITFDDTPIGWELGTGVTFVPPMNFSASSLSAQDMLRATWPEAKTSPHA